MLETLERSRIGRQILRQAEAGAAADTEEERRKLARQLAEIESQLRAEMPALRKREESAERAIADLQPKFEAAMTEMHQARSAVASLGARTDSRRSRIRAQLRTSAWPEVREARDRILEMQRDMRKRGPATTTTRRDPRGGVNMFATNQASFEARLSHLTNLLREGGELDRVSWIPDREGCRKAIAAMFEAIPGEGPPIPWGADAGHDALGS